MGTWVESSYVPLAPVDFLGSTQAAASQQGTSGMRSDSFSSLLKYWSPTDTETQFKQASGYSSYKHQYPLVTHPLLPMSMLCVPKSQYMPQLDVPKLSKLKDYQEAFQL